MDGYGDGPPRRPVRLVAGVGACLVVSDSAGISVLSAFAAGTTGGAVEIPLVEGVALVNEMVEFLIGVVVAAVALAVILAVTGGFDGEESGRDGEVTEREDPDESEG